MRPSKLLHYWDRPGYWEESWRLEEICCHSKSNERPSADANVLYTYRRSNKQRVKTSLTKYTSHFICKISKRVTRDFRMRGTWRPNRNSNILTPFLWQSALCLSRSPDAQPEALGPTLLGDSFASHQQLLWTPTPSGAPSPFGLVWSSLPQLVYNSVRSLTATLWLLSWLSYIIVPRPLSRLLDFWNRMLDRHQAEITVMQFIGHSLPVHQSMSVPWEFFFYLVPFRQPISAHAISFHNCH